MEQLALAVANDAALSTRLPRMSNRRVGRIVKAAILRSRSKQ